MRILVTAGGTREPIDDVRVIANTSTGRLGARLADSLAAAGHEVLLLRGETAAEPRSPAVRREVFGTSAELGALLRRHVPAQDAVVHAAAVADYVPERAAGKLSSEPDELVLRLRRAPKLIDGLRELLPRGVLVGFKLTAGLDEGARVAVARSLLERARLDLVVVNDAARIGERDHEVLLVTAGGVEGRARGKAAVAAALLAALSARAPRQEAAP